MPHTFEKHMVLKDGEVVIESFSVQGNFFLIHACSFIFARTIVTQYEKVLTYYCTTLHIVC